MNFVTKWTSCAVYGAVLSHIIGNLCVHYWFVIDCSVFNPTANYFSTYRWRPCLFAHLDYCYNRVIWNVFNGGGEVTVQSSLVNGQRSDGSFCTVLHQHSSLVIVLSSHCISTLLPMALFCFNILILKHCLSRLVICKHIFELYPMSLNSCNDFAFSGHCKLQTSTFTLCGVKCYHSSVISL